MQGVGTLPPDSPTTNNQQSPNNNVVLPPKPQILTQPTSFRQKKPPMPSPPPSNRMDPEVSFCLESYLFTNLLFVYVFGKFNFYAVRTFFSCFDGKFYTLILIRCTK